MFYYYCFITIIILNDLFQFYEIFAYKHDLELMFQRSTTENDSLLLFEEQAVI